MERVRFLAPVGGNDHAHRERGAILVRAQRAEIVGDALGQHRHDAVGEIDRVAAVKRFAVERGAWPHVMRDVGDGDREDEPARIVGIGVDRGVDRVVMVLGVGRVDGHERKLAPVFTAVFERCGLCGIGFGLNGDGERVRNAVGVDRDQADRPGAGRGGGDTGLISPPIGNPAISFSSATSRTNAATSPGRRC